MKTKTLIVVIIILMMTQLNAQNPVLIPDTLSGIEFNLNLQNGTFEINDKGTQLRPFNHSDFLTYLLPFKFDPNAKAAKFQKYLKNG